jgi:hypothetical protein
VDDIAGGVAFGLESDKAKREEEKDTQRSKAKQTEAGFISHPAPPPAFLRLPPFLSSSNKVPSSSSLPPPLFNLPSGTVSVLAE